MFKHGIKHNIARKTKDCKYLYGIEKSVIPAFNEPD